MPFQFSATFALGLTWAPSSTKDFLTRCSQRSLPALTVPSVTKLCASFVDNVDLVSVLPTRQLLLHTDPIMDD